MANNHPEIAEFMNSVSQKNPHETEFLQAVHEVAEVVIPFIKDNKKYDRDNLLQRMAEPERVIMFRVPWLDDKGIFQIEYR